ncbi:60s acidic ribosomal protein-domain-containing protein [Spinellus fusiger]|nr:60s acidic ribosomal protein-domain-containing protein [Spinellus fusiger]KAI7865158.1 60s acidic ribosomal protein-domain-containing protein [Spinellus fusiger]
MKYLAAYVLLTTGGNAAPSAKDIEALFSSVGVQFEDERIGSLIKALEGKSIDELIAEGKEKIASVPAGGVASAGAAGASAGGAGASAPAAEEEAKDEESEDDDMGFGLFD